MFSDPAELIRRREFMGRGAMGFGSLALASLFQDEAQADDLVPVAPHFPAKAKSVIFLFMDGGVSQVDSFDPKPQLAKENGQKPKFKVDKTVFNQNGNILASPWEFKNRGESGLPVSDLFPHIGSCADDLCVLRSMTSFSPNHPNAIYSLHSGHILTGRPSMGAWTSYGLGTESRDLPSYVVIHGGQVPIGGMIGLGNGFLSATHEPSVFMPKGQVLRNIAPREASTQMQRRKLDLLRDIDGRIAEQREDSEAIRSAIRNYEMAYKMQMSVPGVADLEKESKATRTLYGMEAKNEHTRIYGSQCLMARRLVERGVRFVELTISRPGNDRWDQHSNLKGGHEANAAMVDQPIAGLLKDLKSRGLLESTLVVFAGEFGRTPFAQGSDGRDHNPQGFSIWMAGGGVKGGMAYGATDEYGYRVIDKKMTVHDMHANMLHLMGLDHTKLTYRYGGRDTRLTDVHGEIIPEIMA
ncbi:MAG: DUF1501 domain-containing protein [Verrucomicrobiota bacterium]